MAKELLLYYGMYSYTCADLIKEINDGMGEEVVIRVNSPGGDVFAAWGLFAKIKEHGDVTVKVDGIAASSALNLLLYPKRVESLDISRFLLHRANAYVESPDEQKMLDDINADLRKKLEARVEGELFKKVTGHTIEELFNPETRIDIWIDAKQAKKLGLVSKVNKLEPQEMEEVAVAAMKAFKVAASSEPEKTNKPTPPQSNNTGMTLEKLKAEFPAVYATIFALGVKEEQDRIGSWLAFADIDPDRVKTGIAGKEYPSRKDMAEMQAMAMSPERLNNLSEDGKETADLKPAAAAKPASSTDGKKPAGATMTAEDKELESFQAKLDKVLKPQKEKAVA